jgi:hypothetical protein
MTEAATCGNFKASARPTPPAIATRFDQRWQSTADATETAHAGVRAAVRDELSINVFETLRAGQRPFTGG